MVLFQLNKQKIEYKAELMNKNKEEAKAADWVDNDNE